MIIGLSILTMMFVGGFLAYRSEKRQWNLGLSPATNEPWQYFDTDSQGGRGYRDSAGNYIWISYPFIKKESK